MAEASGPVLPDIPISCRYGWGSDCDYNSASVHKHADKHKNTSHSSDKGGYCGGRMIQLGACLSEQGGLCKTRIIVIHRVDFPEY